MQIGIEFVDQPRSDFSQAADVVPCQQMEDGLRLIVLRERQIEYWLRLFAQKKELGISGDARDFQVWAVDFSLEPFAHGILPRPQFLGHDLIHYRRSRGLFAYVVGKFYAFEKCCSRRLEIVGVYHVLE